MRFLQNRNVDTLISIDTMIAASQTNEHFLNIAIKQQFETHQFMRFDGKRHILMQDDRVKRTSWLPEYIKLLKDPKYKGLFESNALCSLCCDSFEAGLLILNDQYLYRHLRGYDLAQIAKFALNMPISFCQILVCWIN